MRWLCSLMTLVIVICTSACDRHTNSAPDNPVVLIDPGHGGFDGGAVAEDGTLEKHLNLTISLTLRDMLLVCGVPVAMTRTTDCGLEEDASASIREKKLTDMRRRLSMYDGAALVISIHQNQFTQSKYSGTQLFYSANHSDSVRLARSIQESVVGHIQPQNARELKRATDGIYLLYHADVPAVLVECGFLSNPNELKLLKTSAYQQTLAFAIAAGYWDYQMSM